MKIEKDSLLYELLHNEPQEGEIIPYINKFLTINPNAGIYEVDDTPHKSSAKNKEEKFFHPSGDCMKCQRLLYMERSNDYKLLDDTPTPHLQSIFKLGDAIHAMIQAWLAAMSELNNFPHLIGNEYRIYNKEKRISAYIDSVVTFPGSEERIPIEIKSINDYSFNQLSSPKAEHIWQAATYAMELDASYAIVLYYNKNTSDMKEFKVYATDMQPVLFRWQQVLDALHNKDISCLQYGCEQGDFVYKRCPGRENCFNE